LLEPTAADAEGAEVHEFQNATELYDACDKMMARIRDTPEGQFGPDDFDTLDPHDPAHGHLRAAAVHDDGR
jgi:hypothetical protein